MALIVIPTVVAVALGGLRIAESVGTTVTHDHIESMGSLGRSVVVLANELGKERMLSAAYIADDPAPDQRDGDRLTELQEQYKATQQARQKVVNGVNELGEPGTELTANRLNGMLSDLEHLDGIREEVTDTRITVLPAVTKYRQLINSLTGFNETIAEATEDTGLRESVRALSALSKSREQLSYESSLMLHSLMRGTMSGGVKEAIDSSRARYDNEVQNFTTYATVEQRQTYDESFTGLEVSQMSTMRLRVMMRAEDGQSLTGITQGDTAEEYQKNADAALERMQEVEGSMANMVRGQATDLKSSAMNRALLDSLLILAVILAVFIITSVVVRSLVRPLRALRAGALRIAKQDLPDSISRVQEMSTAPENVDVAPIGVTARDEIGEVARSFDEVHRVALQLASDEAALRSNVNAMFVNLSRRSQTLVERQLRLIDGLEQTEQDSDRLSDLFRLDHLATRMRRNNENLLVLSGQDNTRKWAQPVPLVDVLRGAISEVEQYERINVRAPSHISVLGRPVNDVIHLVAELVENATSFSSHDTQVGVTAEMLADGGVQVEVTDSGIGMAPDELEAINERLAEPPVIDVAVSRRMGLFVVSRLAARHGIRVRLRNAHNGGIIACAVFPPDLLITPVESASSDLDGASSVPDTFAEATAAFAANPAPAEPSQVPPDWRADGPSLPKRTPGGNNKSGERDDRDDNKVEEHPPSGQDLWAGTGWNTSANPSSASPSEAQEHPGANAAHAEERPAGAASDSYPRHGGATSGTSSWRNESTVESSLWRTDVTPSPGERPETAWRSESLVSESGNGQGTKDRSSTGQSGARGYGTERREGYGSAAYLSKRYGAGAGAGQNTVVPPSPEGGAETLPIFDAIESNWFKRRTGGPGSADPESGPLPHLNGGARGDDGARHPDGSTAQDNGDQEGSPGIEAQPEPAVAGQSPRPEDEWRSEADRGWKAAQTAVEPIAGGLTSSGLPKRVPKANLVPGTAPQPENVKQIPVRSADRVRNRFTGFQQGLREGRNQTNEQPSEER
ncbi:sensor histidine kinase [Allosalinactinospora lopnorensis]|uniref:sensor histidine kinase n=1 Tax=Allosalinactinospora lopnorensis TaxID=1352348 RepID=UPI001F1AAA45|nr:nitrate- and nitrite sensing domain-containing protein [Allosalinactinospora lopnorensis]